MHSVSLLHPSSQLDALKQNITVTEHQLSTSELSSSSTTSLSECDSGQRVDQIPSSRTSLEQNLDLVPTKPDDITRFDKHRELVAFARAWLFSRKADSSQPPSQPQSAYGSFVKHSVEPLYEWYGRNKRVLTTPALCRIRLKGERDDQDETLLNGTSFNYAGAYDLSPDYESLQQICLDTLPYADIKVVDIMYRTLMDELARFLRADCAFGTATGYLSNIFAITALVDGDWTLLLDEKCHNSIFTGLYLAKSTHHKKFRHNDMAELESLLKNTNTQKVMVIVEGLYR